MAASCKTVGWRYMGKIAPLSGETERRVCMSANAQGSERGRNNMIDMFHASRACYMLRCQRHMLLRSGKKPAHSLSHTHRRQSRPLHRISLSQVAFWRIPLSVRKASHRDTCTNTHYLSSPQHTSTHALICLALFTDLSKSRHNFYTAANKKGHTHT